MNVLYTIEKVWFSAFQIYTIVQNLNNVHKRIIIDNPPVLQWFQLFSNVIINLFNSDVYRSSHKLEGRGYCRLDLSGRVYN